MCVLIYSSPHQYISQFSRFMVPIFFPVIIVIVIVIVIMFEIANALYDFSFSVI